MDSTQKGYGRWIALGIIAVIIIILLFSSFGTVATGDRGIKTRFGKVVGELNTGPYFKIPFLESVDKYDVQTQKEQTDATAASSDLQNVNTTVAIGYRVDDTKVVDVFTRIGDEYKSKIIDPAIQEIVKAVTAKYTAEELITKRAEVTDLIQSGLSDRLASSDILVSSVSIIDFKFSDSFNTAIEAKVTAQQNALAAQNKLAQVQAEAAQTVASAQAQAEAIKIQAQAINSQGGADYVQLQAVNKWNGVLPSSMIPGGTVPFINLK